MKKLSQIFIVLSAFSMILSSCASSRKIPCSDLNLELPQITVKSISLAVWDQREQVLAGKRKPDFVGYMRSGGGIAYPMGTLNEKPIADEIALNISSSFQKNGIGTIVVPTSFKDDEAKVLNNLKKSGNDKLILVKFSKLHYDGYYEYRLLYDLQVVVYRSTGILIDQKSFKGDKILGRPSYFKTSYPRGLQELIEVVFNDPVISTALNK